MPEAKPENEIQRLREFEKEVTSKLLGYLVTLDAIGKGDPSVRVNPDSSVQVIRQLGDRINSLAENIMQFVDQSHREAVDITEFFDVLGKLNKGDYTVRIEQRPRANDLLTVMEEQINELAKVYEETSVQSLELAMAVSILAEISQQVGRGNFKVQAPENFNIEVMNSFARSINQMIHDLKNSYDLIQKLSAPCIKVWEQILVMPLVGVLTSDRAREVMETILSETVKQEARVSIIDVTGIPVMDTATADYLLKTIKAIKILGAEPILTGISPEIAGTIVKMGVELGDVVTKSTLSEGLKYAFKLIQVEVVEK